MNNELLTLIFNFSGMERMETGFFSGLAQG